MRTPRFPLPISPRPAATAALALLASIASLAPAIGQEEVADAVKRVRDAVVIVRPASGSAGSGVLVDGEGTIATASQLIPPGAAVEVEIGGVLYPAKVTSMQTLADLALLKLERRPEKLAPAPLADSTAIEVGTRVMVVGAPLGGAHTLSVGHVTGRRSASTIYAGLAKADLLESDAATHPGQLGAPMFDMKGQLVGVVTGIPTRAPGAIGFAVGSNTIRRLVTEGVPWAGIEAILVSGEFAGLINLPQSAGLLVQRVAPGSMAERRGVRGGSVAATIAGERVILGGDVILEIGGIKVSDPDAGEKIIKILREATPEAPPSVTVLRQGMRIVLGAPAPPK